jgi:endonuclease/exonuclease/phosphatase family metal-dependent hydrolase
MSFGFPFPDIRIVALGPRGRRRGARQTDEMRITLLSWNVAGRTTLLPEQIAGVTRREADLVCLQEVRPSTAPAWAEALAAEGLEFVLDSSAFRNQRRLFNLTASRWELRQLPPVGAPQPERVLSCVSESPAGPVEIHNVHVPPALSNGFTKIETCEALFACLARPSDRHRLLCGDFNAPRSESVEGAIETFALNHPGHEERWDAAERSLLEGLREWDLRDAFRQLNGYDRRDVSWVFHTRSRRKAAHRLDHVLASAGLRPRHCDYLHEWREAGLSDHSAMEALFEPAHRTVHTEHASRTASGSVTRAD